MDVKKHTTTNKRKFKAITFNKHWKVYKNAITMMYLKNSNNNTKTSHNKENTTKSEILLIMDY